jgi:hypothetical protein
MKIGQNNIYGGNQQFADKIVNHHSNLSESDHKVIDLIASDNGANYDQELISKSIEQVKSTKASSQEKEHSKSVLKKIFDTGLTEATKMAVKALIDQGMNYLDFLQ